MNGSLQEHNTLCWLLLDWFMQCKDQRGKLLEENSYIQNLIPFPTFRLAVQLQVHETEAYIYVLRKCLISSQNIPYFTNRSFHRHASNNTAMDTSIFLQPKTILSVTVKTKVPFSGRGRPDEKSLESISYQ